MKRVHLRFDSQPASPSRWLAGSPGRPTGRLGIALLAAAAGVLLFEGWQLAQARQELAAIQGELLALAPSQPAAPVAIPALKSEQRQAWNQLAAQLNAPWATLLAGLEAATPDDVALVSIEPDARQSVVRVQAEAKTLETLLAYAEALERTKPFGDVVPLKHETNEQDPNRPVRVTLRLWLGAPTGAVTGPGDVR